MTEDEPGIVAVAVVAAVEPVDAVAAPRTAAKVTAAVHNDAVVPNSAAHSKKKARWREGRCNRRSVEVKATSAAGAKRRARRTRSGFVAWLPSHTRATTC